MGTKVVILASLLLAVGCGQQVGGSPDLPQGVVLHSITVTPDTTSIQVGTTAPFAATGTYSNGTTGPIAVNWDVSDHLVATVDGTGLVTALQAGNVLLTATSIDFPTVQGFAAVTVTPLPPPPPIITTTTLANATVGQVYNQTLHYDFGGGIPTWSVITGSLPPGLTLDPVTGVISGTPTNPGGILPRTISFTVQVDAMGTDTQDLGIRVGLLSTGN